MRKVLVVFMMIALASAAFAKEYHWGVSTRWPNNNPDVVKTMPAVQNFMKECGINIKNAEFVDIDEDDRKTVDAVIKHAEKLAAKNPEVGQFIYYNDVSNIFIIVNFGISEISGENVCDCIFAMKLQIGE